MVQFRKKVPSPRVLRRLVSYCPETGELTWKARPVWMFKTGGTPVRRVTRQGKARRFAAKYEGQKAFKVIDGKGYLTGEVFGIPLKASRVAWAIHYGEWPSDQVDHKNRNRTDNRIGNLRCVDTSLNCKNRGLRIDNKSGHAGVRLRNSGSWRATITSQGNVINLGSFATFEEAVIARKSAEKKLGFFANHGRAA